MEALSETFSNLYNKTTIFLTLLLLQLITLLTTSGYALYDSGYRLIATTQFLNHIEHKFPTLVYNVGVLKVLDEPSSDDECMCSVCLSNFESGDKMRRLCCNHTFHKDCIDKWMQRDYAASSTCPLCRQKVLSDETLEMFKRPLESDGNDFVELVLFFSSLQQGSNNFIS